LEINANLVASPGTSASTASLASSCPNVTCQRLKDLASPMLPVYLDMVGGTVASIFVQALSKVAILMNSDFCYSFRLCPGRYFAMNSFWLLAASLIQNFDFNKPIGPSGKSEEPHYEVSPGQVAFVL
jgi:hypothetical protein